MNVLNKLWIATAAAVMSFSATAEAPAMSLELGFGSSEYSLSGPSEHGTQADITVAASWEQGLLLGLSHIYQDYSDINLEFGYTALQAGWRFAVSQNWNIDVGLEADRLQAKSGGATITDDGFGAFIAAGVALSDEVRAGLELSYSETDDNDEVLDMTARVDMDMTDTVSLGLKYWARNISAPGVAGELDQETIAIVLGLHF